VDENLRCTTNVMIPSCKFEKRPSVEEILPSICSPPFSVFEITAYLNAPIAILGLILIQDQP
jgi:hypothetical protein